MRKIISVSAIRQMKRITSFMLALLIVMALLPAFPVGAESGITIKYGMSKGLGYNFANATKISTIDYDATNGFYRYVGRKNPSRTESAYVTFYNDLKFYCYGVGDYVALGINVPAAGEYDVTFNYLKYKQKVAGGYGAAWILPGNTADIASAISDNSTAIADFEYFTEAEANENASKTVNAVSFPTAGEYYVVYKLTGENSDASSADNSRVMYPSDITLTSASVNGPLPMRTLISSSKTSLIVGEQASISTEISLSDGTWLSEEKISYESLTPSVTSVDDSGNVTALAAGKADIKVTADCGGDQVSKVLSLGITNTPPAGVKVTYDLVKNRETGSDFPWKDSAGYVGNIGYAQTGGMWAYKDISSKIPDYATNGRICMNPSYGINFGSSGTNWLALSINVPVSGAYDVSFGYSKYKYGACANVYMVPEAEASTNAAIENVIANKAPVASFDCYSSEVTAITGAYEKVLGCDLEAGEYVIIYKCVSRTSDWTLFVGNIVLDGGDNLAPMITASTNESMKIGDTAEIVASANYLSDGSSIAGAELTYESLNDCVSVSGTTVTAEKAGNAELKVRAAYNGVTSEKPLSIKVEADEEPSAPSTVTLGIMAENVGDNKVAFGTYSAINSLSIGDTVSVSAPEVAGYSFKYWRTNSGYAAGTKDYSFKIYGNTALFAVYEKDDAGSDNVTVEFLNGNGTFVERQSVAKGTLFSEMTKPSVSLTGFNFLNWALASGTDAIDSNTTAVAQYEASDANESLSINGTSGTYGYDETISATDATAKYWTRDGKVVAYGTDYEFHAWSGSSEIVSHSDEIEIKPVVVLDDDTINGAYMIEYDVPVGYTKLEVGIIFGSGATVGSYQSKAVSKSAQSVRHGQFTAIPKTDGDVATGYIIYTDGENVRVVYSK